MKGGSDSVANRRGGAGKRSGTTSISMPCVFKFLAPEALAAAIIGKGGAAIAAMRESCQAKITVTEYGDWYPQTDGRVVTGQANTEEALNDLSKQVVAKVVESANGEEELKFRVLVPRSAVGGFIGKGGANIKQLREATGAKISTGDPTGAGPGAEQLVSVQGTAEGLETVLIEVNKQVQSLNGEPWFAAWAATTVPQNQLAAGNLAGALAAGSAGSAQLGASMQGNPYASPSIDTMVRVANGLPPYVMEDSRGFALSCVVPNRLVGGLIGRGGAGTKEIQQLTGTKIGIREIPDDPDSRSLNITGPLCSTCAAYMLMMKRYLDVESQTLASRGQS
mmetsp:Transcript_134892/g.262706  ORF Transcript_134892/g.262706 Transcript_134892/m.262706 type:complete len:336 (-) Transcript_134892:258-1265(-)